MRSLNEAWRHLTRWATGPSYVEVAEAGRALAQSIVDGAKYRSKKQLGTSAYWDKFMSRDEAAALQNFNELFDHD